MTKKSFRRAFRDSLPIMAGYLALGIGYGVLLQSKGYSFWWAILMSVTMFAGSGQYAGVDFMASGASLLLRNAVINVKNIGAGAATNVAPLEFDIMSNGKPVFTPAA